MTRKYILRKLIHSIYRLFQSEGSHHTIGKDSGPLQIVQIHLTVPSPFSSGIPPFHPGKCLVSLGQGTLLGCLRENRALLDV